MSEQWTPKVGDKVMVGEHGPYRVEAVVPEDSDYVQVLVGEHSLRSVCPEWLTPAPEPEPGEPKVRGALVKIETSSGPRFAARIGTDDGIGTDDYFPWVVTGHTGGWSWVGLKSFQSPITVVLADPAEVETLREKVAEGQRLVEEMTPALIERDALRAEVEKCQEDRERIAADRDRFAERIDEIERDYESAAHERDELQRRISQALGRTLQGVEVYHLSDFIYEQAAILRGES